MMPASSNSFTVRYTVEIEILSSTATQRRYSSSTSGWSSASANTRAMTRRCSVMRMPVAAQRASMPVAFEVGDECADEGLSAVMGRPWKRWRWFATNCSLRQVAPHQKRIQLFPAGLLVIPLAAADDAESGPFIKPPRRRVVFLDLEKYCADAAAREMAEMDQQQIARQAAAAIGRIDCDRQYLGLIGAHARDRKADHLAPELEAMHQRVAFAQHALELGFAPAAMK